MATIRRIVTSVETDIKFAAAVLVMGVILLANLFVGYLTLVQGEALIRIDNNTYQSVTEIHCPGDTITVTPTITYLAAPHVIQKVRSWFSLDRHATVLSDEHPDYRVVSETGTYSLIQMFQVPMLPPGRYELRVGYSAPEHPAAFYNVPFEISDKCKVKE